MSNVLSAIKNPESASAKAWYFLRHLFEMCLSMSAGMVVLGPLFDLAVKQLGYAHPYTQIPEAAVLANAFMMALPMAAWMRYRGMKWRHINEMSAPMLIQAIVLIALLWLGVITTRSLMPLQHGLMCPLMLIPMFLRLDLYTSRKCH